MSSLRVTWQAHERAALDLLQMQRAEDAEREIREAIRLNPFESRLYLLLTHALFWQGRLVEAEQESWNGFRLAPPDRQLTVQLANFYLGNWDFARARRFAAEAVSRQPQSIPARLLLMRALVGLGLTDTALEEARRARHSLGDHPAILAEEADVFDIIGQREQACELYEASLNRNPLQGKPYFALTQSAAPNDEGWMEKLSDILAKPETPKSERPYLLWALGRLLERKGDFGGAMSQYDSANLASAEVNQVRGKTLEEVDMLSARLKARYSDAWLREAQNHGIHSARPIFVVGMMRSGTTLVEQVLARHPDVGTVGEQAFWTIQMRQAVLPHDVGSFATSYLSLLKDRDPVSDRIVDKMPSNYLHLGLIAAALPDAAIVHVKRDPVDTCLSLWSTPRASPVEWGFSKSSVVCHYRAYCDIMSHWADQIPENRIHTLSYESLVSNSKEEIRRLLDFCHLNWHEECLFPERSGRTVATPSAAQVRRPINRDSVNRWERFLPWLGEFADLHN